MERHLRRQELMELRGWCMLPTIAMLALASAAPAAAGAPASPAGGHWRNCGIFERADGGIVVVDRWAMVIFDAGEARISDHYGKLLDSYAAEFEAVPACPIVIEGHSDLAEAGLEDTDLSRRRADAVGAYLRSKGLTERITVRAFGGSRPMVETAMGVSEAQNRYVQVWVEGPP